MYKVILKTMVVSGNEMIYVDTISYRGQNWLVPYWLNKRGEEGRTPERMILLDSIPHQMTPDAPNHDFLVNNPIPRSVLEGKSTDGYDVIELPDMWDDGPRGGSGN